MLTVTLIFLIVMKIRKWRVQQGLKWQQLLCNKGIGFHTRIQEIIEKRSVNGYKKIVLKALLRVNGKLVCKKVHTLVKAGEQLSAGDKVIIRYMPGKLHVMIAGNAA
jgi:hypothetical protein